MLKIWNSATELESEASRKRITLRPALAPRREHMHKRAEQRAEHKRQGTYNVRLQHFT